MANATNNRPLSPHLQVYKLIPTMVASIVHRITGGALYFGTLLVAWWLIAIASGPAYYDWVNWAMGTIIGRLILIGYTWALVHHMLGGFRHFMWDLGYGFEKHFTTKLAKASWVVSICLTALIWVIALIVR
ncbi:MULTISPECIES: succinate dehydrogenase, cytochrome b556 subunit [unclassified Agrobacterium]|jgi:succinate dehydrogenase / fumarate reductase cytochrome b subunit|uniref:succinate dehydrogenase, cytochrome b556 subunit n=1 Tax=unclassified Agrobacterium TaxID=2632611 RepID=UPI002449C96C|nr:MULTISPECIES: succinate dehydrogenase, cytochrome b556 subunit [unclassified Agrobacterium]MDH0614644.1 succinate dehydrogenase, cytochrome b556 subunit [Agrobacterium sp. GD03872]MDH0697113.1 succinate dehydrogenase, cytochrome b556 subunit [Agrobacterium sp. GD03871]MDH1059593.1 succinate dehydrogenase, cytochrome b556 subunit [Agrobacterium sp. GD03992]MDH2212454.1 succinate dehydrogenase, cytochrome b556 subunit [Agrobacterium sp. GD03643]MDH2219924.1 succinate dehydrogenase, cytochrome